MISKIFPSIGSWKGYDIEEPGLQEQKLKILYPEKEVKHILIQILSCPQSGYRYYHVCFLRLTHEAGQAL